MVGRYRTTVEDMVVPYVKPQSMVTAKACVN